MQVIFKECVVIGAGISGIAAARWLKQYGIDFTVLEMSNGFGGLWRYREDDYGVMEFTHINVSKHNYCFSDHPFPDETIDYPHHSDMFKYIESYVEKHSLAESIQFKTKVLNIEEIDKKSSDLLGSISEQSKVDVNKKLWKISIKDLETNVEKVIVTNYTCIASGHHGMPLEVKFPGQETFPGDVIHSVKFKSAKFNNMTDKRVLVVGIGNSAVDVCTNLCSEGRSKVALSTRSGAWIFPNYLNGFPMDLYACRTFLNIPWKLTNVYLQFVLKFVFGDPKKYNLNPKMKVLQAQPTVSPTLIHHIQRRHITVKPNIKNISGKEVTFENGDKEEFDSIITCTGYKLGLNFLSSNIRNKIFKDDSNAVLNLYKQVFHPEIGSSLGFIGFAQPSSGGLLLISEVQARWFVHLLRNDVTLPPTIQMTETIEKDFEKSTKRFYSSSRHTIQQDPIIYNDEVTEHYGAKPDLYKNFPIAWRLLMSSCGPNQWRLNGPDATEEATDLVAQVPVTSSMKFFAFIAILLVFYILWSIISNPLIAFLIILPIGMFQFYKKNKTINDQKHFK